MAWMRALSGEQLAASVGLAAVAFVALGLLLGFTRRTLGAAVVVVLAVGRFYPGGTVGLVVDALGPLRALTHETASLRDERRERIDSEVGDTPGR